MKKEHLETEIISIKKLRLVIDETCSKVKEHYTDTRSKSIALIKLEEARMWLGKHLAEIGDQTPYKLGNDVTTLTFEPTADVSENTPGIGENTFTIEVKEEYFK